MILLYNIGIKIYRLAIRLAAVLGHQKAKLWIDGRNRTFEDLRKKISENDQYIWFHAASLGEFEQGRPLIEQIKVAHPEYRILLTFYSPSGYEIRKNYPKADIVCYLPVDTVENARKFLDIIKPTLVVFIKYEFWYHFLNQATLRNIRVIYIAALFRPGMIYFSPLFTVFLPVFRKINHFFVQNEPSRTTLIEKVAAIKRQSISVVGDPRIDRVVEIAESVSEFELIKQFCADKKVLVAGSTWEQDIVVLRAMEDFSEWRLIVAPHELREKHYLQIEKQWGEINCLRYSCANIEQLATASVLIIDNIGMLSSIYKYAKIAYVGGGFGAGIHNTLEPMAFGIPVIFGPKYEQFEEAVEMVKQEGAFCINSSEDFSIIFKKLSEYQHYNIAQKAIKNYMVTGRGATQKIMDYCKKIL